MFKVSEDELNKLCVRESEYLFDRSVAYDFNNKRKKIGDCLVLVDYFIKIDKKKKLPSRTYFILCRKAAYKISRKFGKMWDETTYISDNEKVFEWIKKNKDYDKL